MRNPFKRKRELIDVLPTDYLEYIIEKTDEYSENYIETNWHERADVPLSNAYRLIDIGMFKLKIQKELKRRKENDIKQDN